MTFENRLRAHRKYLNESLRALKKASPSKSRNALIRRIEKKRSNVNAAIRFISRNNIRTMNYMSLSDNVLKLLNHPNNINSN